MPAKWEAHAFIRMCVTHGSHCRSNGCNSLSFVHFRWSCGCLCTCKQLSKQLSQGASRRFSPTDNAQSRVPNCE